MPDIVSFFSGANSTHISNGHFNAVEGDQINQTTVCGDLIQCSHTKKEEWTIEDEYVQVPTGRVKLIKEIQKGERYPWLDWRDSTSVHVVSISNEQPDARFTRISYGGHEAKKAFMEDFQQFSRVKDIQTMQLFGFNKSETFPALIFSDEAVPLVHVLGQHHLSFLTVHHFLPRIFSMNKSLSISHTSGPLPDPIWIHSSGKLSHGVSVRSVSGRYPYRWWHFIPSEQEEFQEDSSPPIPLGRLGETELLWKRFVQSFSGAFFLRCCRYRWGDFRWQETNSSPSLCHGRVVTKVRRSDSVIAEFPAMKFAVHAHFENSEDKRNATVTMMKNGSVCFAFAQPASLPEGGIVVGIKVYPEHDTILAWLSQSWSIFTNRRIPPSEWGGYAVVSSWTQSLKIPPFKQSPPLGDPIYLFLLATGAPNRSSDDMTWNVELTSFWSNNPAGRSWIPPEKCQFLGLPDIIFEGEQKRWIDYFSYQTYESIKIYQELKGFDPSTADFARSLGFPILEIIPEQDILPEDFGSSFLALESIVQMDVDGEASADQDTNTHENTEPSYHQPLSGMGSSDSSQHARCSNTLESQENHAGGQECKGGNSWGIGNYFRIPRLLEPPADNVDVNENETGGEEPWLKAAGGFFFV